MYILKYRLLTIVGIFGLTATAAPVTAAAADPLGESEKTETAAPETPDCDPAAQTPKRYKSRVVNVGPRQYFIMRVDDDEAKDEAATACAAEADKVEVRTIYVGPRQNVTKKVVKKPSDDD